MAVSPTLSADAVAERHTGVFHDKAHPDVRFYARKKKYGWRDRRLKSMDKRREAAQAFAAEIMPQMPAVLKTTVTSDWE